jgi:hypothetical protein
LSQWEIWLKNSLVIVATEARGIFSKRIVNQNERLIHVSFIAGFPDKNRNKMFKQKIMIQKVNKKASFKLLTYFLCKTFTRRQNADKGKKHFGLFFV